MQGSRASFRRARLGHGPLVSAKEGCELSSAGSWSGGAGSEFLPGVQATTSLETELTEPREAITRSQGGWTTSSTSVATGWALRRSRMPL